MTDLVSSPAWVADAIFYQIFPDRFARSERLPKPRNLEAWDDPPTVHGYKGGDLAGVEEHLDWIEELGCNAIYFNPIFQSASNHRYHTHDYYRVDPLLGGDEAFDSLLAECRRRNIRVVLDGVFNHSSRGFFQFNDLLENGAKSPWVDWWRVHDWPVVAYGANAPTYDAWWNLPALPKFNTDNRDVREYLMQVGEHWAQRGIDGWRLDVPAEITTPGFWEEFRTRCRAINPDLYLVGELWHDAGDWINEGDRFDGTMNYLFTSYVVSFVVGRRVQGPVVEGLSYQAGPPIDATGYRDRIDQLLGMYPARAGLSNLNLLDSHDTPRLLTVAGGDRDSLVLAALALFTFPGAPSVFYGDEIGMAGGKDPEMRGAFPWGLQEKWDTELLEAYRTLIALRHAHPALRNGEYHAVWPPAGEIGSMLYLFLRRNRDETLLVGINAGDEAEVAALSRIDLPTNGVEVLWGEGDLSRLEHTLRISIPPRSGTVWSLHSSPAPAGGVARA